MSEYGHKPVWDGKPEQTPWWWPYIIQLERHANNLRESAAYDYEKKPPPKSMWTLSAAERLEDEWYAPRRKEAERIAREKRPMDDW